MSKLKITARFIVALLCLTTALLLSIQFNNRGVQFDLKPGDAALLREKGTDDEYKLSSLNMLNRVLLRIKDNYVEPERIDPVKMFGAALDEIQNSVAEVVIQRDLATKPGVFPAKLKVSVGAATKDFDISSVSNLWELTSELQRIMVFIDKHLERTPELKLEDIEYAAINGMLDTLDPHSVLLPPRDYNDMKTQTSGKFGGLGIVISIRDGVLTVISPLEDTPAAKKGIKSRDQIVRIGDESTVNMTINEAVEMLRGDPGTTVILWVLRQGWEEPKKFEVERAEIKIKSVRSEPLAGKVGYISIKSFQGNTAGDVREHLKMLKAKMGGMQGLVLDLRGNPGGLLDQSIRISDLFLKEGTIVNTVAGGNRIKDQNAARAGNTEPDYPIVVLVSSGSASASEIVSGALQNNERAIVLGDTTFGKGSVQVIYDMPKEVGLKLTIAQYLTPGGVSIQGRGISPDIRTIPVSVKKGEVDMFLPKNVLREGSLDQALTNDAVRKDTPNEKFVRYLNLEETKDDEFANPDQYKEDFDIRAAQRLIVAAGTTWKRQELLDKLSPTLEKLADDETLRIEKELKTLGVDWSKGPTPKAPSYTLNFDTGLKPGQAIEAGETLTIKATLTNTGTEPFYRLKAITQSDNAILSEREFPFGKVSPGQSASWSVEVKVPKELPAREDLVEFEVSDADTILSSPKNPNAMTLRIDALPRPHFGFTYEVIDPSGDGLLQLDEEVKLRLFVTNTGKADSAETFVYVKNNSGDAVFLERGRDKIEKLPKGSTEVKEFSFKVKKAPTKQEDAIELEFDIYDTAFREFAQKKITIPFATTTTPVSKKRGHLTINADSTKLYTGAHKDVAAVASVPRGTTLGVTGQLGEWYKVNIGQKREAWVMGKDATYDATPKPSDKISAMALFRSPEIDIAPETSMTDLPTVHLKGTLKDTGKIRDYYIFVYNREDSKFNTRKITYHRVDADAITLDEPIPLFEGMNRIAIYVRDEDGMTATHSSYVYRR